MIEHGPGADVPADWDRLAERDEPPRSSEVSGSPRSSPPLPVLTVVAAGWGDALSVLVVCTAEVAAVHMLGHGYGVATVLWATAAAFAWWVLASAVLLVVRQATPGMLLAGIALSGPVAPSRIPWVLLAAAVSALCVGLPGLLGPRRHPVAMLAGETLVMNGTAAAAPPSNIRRDA